MYIKVRNLLDQSAPYSFLSNGEITGVGTIRVKNINSFAFTPTLTCATVGNLSVAYTTRLASYSIIGRQILMSFYIYTSTWTFTTASGNLQITGLPVSAVGYFAGSVDMLGITKANYTNFSSVFNTGTDAIEFYAAASAQARSAVTAANTTTTTDIFMRTSIKGMF